MPTARLPSRRPSSAWYTDIDFAAYGRQVKKVRALLSPRGLRRGIEMAYVESEGSRMVSEPSWDRPPSRRLPGQAGVLPHDLVGRAAENEPLHDPARRDAAAEDADRSDQREGHHRHDHAVARAPTDPEDDVGVNIALVATTVRERLGLVADAHDEPWRRSDRGGPRTKRSGMTSSDGSPSRWTRPLPASCASPSPSRLEDAGA